MTSPHHHDPSSSVNSADAGSHHGTPDTKLTALSPEDFQFNQINTTQRILRPNQPPPFLLGTVPVKGGLKGKATRSTTAGHQDPFITIGHASAAACSTEQPKLSAAAPSFTPSSLVGRVGDSIVSHTLMVPADASGGGWVHSPVSLLSTPLASETLHGQVSFERHLSPAANGTHLSHSSQTSPSSICSPVTGRERIKSGRFSSDSPRSRSVMISQIPQGTAVTEIETLVPPHKFRSRKDLVLDNLSVTGTIYVSFTDIRDAREAEAAIHELRKDWLIEYIPVPPNSLQHHTDYCSTSVASKYEGQLLVRAEFSGPAIYFDLDTVSRLILDLLNNYGSIMAYDAVITIHPIVAYRAEFFDTKDADYAIAHLDGFRIAGCTMSVHRYEGEGPLIIGQEDTLVDKRFQPLGLDASPPAWMALQQYSPLPSPYPGPSSNVTETLTPRRLNTQNIRVPNYMAQPTGSRSLLSPYIRSFPTPGMQALPWAAFDTAPYESGAIGQERNSPLSPISPVHAHAKRHGGRHVQEYAGGHHNIVEVNRIRQGADVRTTIMLRNIPNKIDQTMLKDIIDETSRGKYDFMYLRIDFANNCNVGYAFINFEDPIHIIDFVYARAGHRWNRFNSDKVAEVSYATIQGKDCLVQKFRNSSVMLEHPSFRPKIFRTGDDALGGTEEPFPGPDNPSKMRRSVENAEHVGLFAPRAGQNFRDEQRRRRSQYDRGTRLAEIEDNYRFIHKFVAPQPGHVHHISPHAHRFRYAGQHTY